MMLLMSANFAMFPSPGEGSTTEKRVKKKHVAEMDQVLDELYLVRLGSYEVF